MPHKKKYNKIWKIYPARKVVVDVPATPTEGETQAWTITARPQEAPLMEDQVEFKAVVHNTLSGNSQIFLPIVIR